MESDTAITCITSAGILCRLLFQVMIEWMLQEKWHPVISACNGPTKDIKESIAG
jgi:hypothetical protein